MEKFRVFNTKSGSLLVVQYGSARPLGVNGPVVSGVHRFVVRKSDKRYGEFLALVRKAGA